MPCAVNVDGIVMLTRQFSGRNTGVPLTISIIDVFGPIGPLIAVVNTRPVVVATIEQQFHCGIVHHRDSP